MKKEATRDEYVEIRALLGLEKQRASRLSDRKLLIWGGVAALLLLLVLAVVFRSGSDAADRYIVEPVGRVDLTVVIAATGSVQPTKQVDVSSELSGTVRTVFVDYNSPVKVGQVLAELDTDKLKATVEQLARQACRGQGQGRRRGGHAGREGARDYERKKTLATSRCRRPRISTPPRRPTIAPSPRSERKADVGVAEADLKLNETNLAKSASSRRSTASCWSATSIPARPSHPPSRPRSCSPSPRTSRRWKSRSMSTRPTLARSRKASKATFTVDAFPDRKFQAAIRELRFGSEIVQGVVTYKAILVTDNSELLLRPGMTATAEIIVQHVADALAVPNAALRYSPPSQEAGTGDACSGSWAAAGPPKFRPASNRRGRTKPHGLDR